MWLSVSATLQLTVMALSTATGLQSRGLGLRRLFIENQETTQALRTREVRLLDVSAC